ncbi:hypothetical protein PIB30_092998 [Stylosanthes scabra]|uniref:Transposase MuDR plant domain-containing protein n=1 Tax=Stylosanthes scabra TaxID=79078 RepID=A0ABU6SVI7_9FABA|nr:hypothetical protein [Stylosanthes scabra]
MVLFDINLFHKGHFGYVDGHMRYLEGKKTVIMENDSLWYKDPAADNLETSLIQLTTDSDALHMVRIGDLRGSVDLFVVHEMGLAVEGFPEIGWIDVGDDEEGASRGNANGVADLGANNPEAKDPEEDGHGEEAGAAPEDNVEAMDDGGGHNVISNNEGGENEGANSDVAENEGADGEVAENEGANEDNAEVAEGAVSNEDIENGEDESDGTNEEQGKGHGSVDDDTKESEYVPSEKNTDSADDVQFTDSEEDLDLDDNGFGIGEKGSGGGSGSGSGNGNGNGNGVADKGKGKVNEDFSHDEGSEELEGIMMQWRVGTVYASRDEFKETVSTYAVYTVRGIKFDYCDRKWVIAICQQDCPFRLYCVKVNEEETWQLRSINVKHNCAQVQRVGIMHSKWLRKAFKRKVEVNPKVKIKEFVAKADRK